MALQTLLKEYTEVTKSPKENKMYSQLQPAKMRPRRKARKYLYAIGSVSNLLFQFVMNFGVKMKTLPEIFQLEVLEMQFNFGP